MPSGAYIATNLVPLCLQMLRRMHSLPTSTRTKTYERVGLLLQYVQVIYSKSNVTSCQISNKQQLVNPIYRIFLRDGQD